MKRVSFIITIVLIALSFATCATAPEPIDYSGVDINEINRIAQITAESFHYYLDSTNTFSRGNFYRGNNEMLSACTGYALLFVLLWNEAYPEYPAEIVVIDQHLEGWDLPPRDGSYRIVRQSRLVSDHWYLRSGRNSGITRNPSNNSGVLGIYQKDLGFYEIRLTRAYTAQPLLRSGGGGHLFARVGDIYVDPTMADTSGHPFIVEVIIR